jgi:hypothetical protein
MGFAGPTKATRSKASRSRSWLRRLLAFSAALAPILLVGGQAVGRAPVAAASPGFTFNWNGTPAAPERWVPAAANDWDLMQSNGVAGDSNVRSGAFPAVHGGDCSAPPATHTVSLIADTAYLCNNHMMTALNDGAVFFTPNQLLDFSHGTARVTFQVSTFRNSARDWWEVWLTPWSENFVTPTDEAPVFEGGPSDALHIQQQQRNGCSIGQAGPAWVDANSGIQGGTFFAYDLFAGGKSVQNGGDGPCMEDLAGGPSAKTRSTFELDVSSGHVTFGMQGAGGSGTWVNQNMNLPFDEAVVTFAHRSYNPSKACGFNGTCGPNTFHWSNVSMSPTVPFTMLRPVGNAQLHDGTATTVTLPQAAPANSFLRFSAFGTIAVSYDHGAFVSPHMQDTGWRAEGASNYFSPVPTGTKTITFQGSSRGGMDWWMEDVSVWATAAPMPGPASVPNPGTTVTKPAPAVAPPTAVPTAAMPAAPPAAASNTTTTVAQTQPRPGNFGAALASVPYNHVTLPIAGFLALLGLGFGGVAAARYVRRRRAVPQLPSK